MPTDVIMPQMGESIAEGTVIKWIKKVGDQVERDEPLFEISTDKVDAEIPAPAAGTLSEILVEEGKTVPINTVVARLSGAGEAAAPPASPAAPEPKAVPEPALSEAVPPPAPPPAEEPTTTNASPAQAEANAAMKEDVRQEATGVEPARGGAMPAPQQPDHEASEEKGEDSEGLTSLDERRRKKSSPLVRKIAAENDIDISRIQGSGISGRVTKNDILQFMEKPQPTPAPAASPSQPAAVSSSQPVGLPSPPPAAAAVSTTSRPQPITLQQAGSAVATPLPTGSHARPSFSAGQNISIEPMSRMRKSIAEHMVQSKRTSAHVTTVFEVDFTEIDKLRRQHKANYSERGAKITYLPFVVQAVITALREFPIVNASIDGDNVIYRKDLNIGIAVALDWGLIVPVLKNADEKNILGLAKAINDLGERARSKKLNPDEVQGGTFTITNPGIYGGLFGTPIINQPQVAILGVGGVKKRPIVIETEEGDAIVIRSMCILSLTFDHRLIDGAVADQFMARVRQLIEDAAFAM